MTQARGTNNGATSPRSRGIAPADLSARDGVSRGGARDVTTGAASATGTDIGAEIATGAETVAGTGIATGAETAATAGAMAMGVGRAGEVARTTVVGVEVVAVTEG